MAEASIRVQDPFLKQRYDLLWSNSIERIRSGNIEIDSMLARKEVDRRRGMTLLIRPSEPIRRRISQFIDQLRALEPDQHYYHPDELHVTFLSLFTATEKHEAFFARADEYIGAVSASVERFVPFPMFFEGVTASAGAILVQGFTDAKVLNIARDNLRHELRSRGLGEGLDERYRLETAHMTVARFRQPAANGRILAQVLEQMRTFGFGELEVDSLELVKNNWYQSRGITEGLRNYPLMGLGIHKNPSS